MQSPGRWHERLGRFEQSSQLLGLWPGASLSTIPKLFNPFSPGLFSPYDYYEPSQTTNPTGQVSWPPVVNSRGRQWSGLVAATGQFLLSLD
ncbi:MAG: hypothetical protein ACYCQM_15125, partial [Acidithiobacillus sp.]